MLLKSSQNSQENICIGVSFLTLICIKWVPEYPTTIFLTTSFTWKIPVSSDSIYCHATKRDIIILPEVDSPYKKCWILFQFSLGPRGTITGTKRTIPCGFGPLQVKLWYHISSSMKMEECMDSELCSTFRVKLMTKNICLGHWRPKAVLSLQCVVSFWSSKQMLWNRQLDFSVFLVK